MGTSYTTPTNPDWGREPIERTEIVWIAIAFAWCLFMFGWMVGWHWIGNQKYEKRGLPDLPRGICPKTGGSTDEIYHPQ